MYAIDKERVRAALLLENFQSLDIDILLKNYPSIPDELGKLVDKWFIDQEIPDLEIDGISLIGVMEKRHAHFLVAIRDLSKFLEPEMSAEKRAQWHRILTTSVFYE
jgi:hypothetical protein